MSLSLRRFVRTTLLSCLCLTAASALQAQISFTSGTLPAGAVSTPYNFAFTALGPGCSEEFTTNFSFSSTDLPAWLTLNSGSNIISGTPPAAQSYSFHVTPHDNPCNTNGASTLFTINVNSPQEYFYLLNPNEGGLTIQAYNGGKGFTCAWAQETDPCFAYSTGDTDFVLDNQGNILVAAGQAVLKFAPGNSKPTIVAPATSLPNAGFREYAYFLSVAVDSAGNYIVADTGNNSVWLFPAGGGTATQVGTYAGGGMGYGDVYVRYIPGSPGKYALAEDEGSDDTPSINLYLFTACQTSPSISCPALQSPNPLLSSPVNGYYVSGLAVVPGSYSGPAFIITAVYDDEGPPQILNVSNTGDGYVAQLMYNVPGYTLESAGGISVDPVTGNYDFVSAYSGSLYDMSSGPLGNAGIGQIAQSEGFGGILAVLALPVQQQVVTPPPTAPIPPLVITGGALPSGYAYEPYSAGVSASGGVQPYAFTAAGLPAGLTMNQYGAISGVTSSTGTFSVQVSVTDQPGASASATYTLAITPPPPVSVPGGTLTSVIVQTPVSVPLTATGGAPPYTWSLVSGTLPPGVTLQSSGNIFGTPLIVGTYSFTVSATDSHGSSALGTFSMTILPHPLTTSSGTLPSGMVSVGYGPVSLTASGGTAPYTYAVTTGSLPPGLTLAADGLITGTPTNYTPTSGDSFTVTATDSGAPPSTGTATYSIYVAPNTTNLILSAASVGFTLSPPAPVLPASQAVTVGSSNTQQVLGWSASVSPASANWLSVTANGSKTPGSFAVGLTPAALTLAASTTPYTATITVTCTSGCSANTQTVAVSLSVTSSPAQLSVLTTELSFSTQASNPQPTSGALTVSNTGGGSIGFASVGCAASWCSVSGVPTSIPSGGSASFTVTANPAGLSAGYSWTDVTIASSAGKASVPVTLFIAGNGLISLAPAGALFSLPQGGEAVGNSSFLVNVTGTTSVSFNASVSSSSTPWLSVTQSSSTVSSSQPATVNLVFDQSQVEALAAGTYYGTVAVTSGGASNSPQSFEVVLNVTPTGQVTTPNPVPGGLTFLTQTSGSPAPQTVTVDTGSISGVSFQASAGTFTGGNWLSVSPTTGTTSAASPAQTTVTADPSGLAPGVYTGLVNYQFSATAVRSVNVTLVVENVTSGGAPGSTITRRDSTAACTATQIVPTSTALVSNFSAPAAWPIELEVNLVDDCGNPLNNGQVVATFSNGDPPLILSVVDTNGDYTGTWTPQHTSNQITVNALASSSGLPNAQLQLAGQVTANNAPILANASIANFYNPVGGAPLAPGTLVQITGQYLAGQTLSNSQIPLPTTLGGTSVIIGGLQAPVTYVSPGQIDAQVPFELPAGQPYQVIVNANNALTTPQSFQAGGASPGLSVLPSGYVQATHQNGTPVTETAPAAPGENIAVYLVGMGATTITVASGQPGPGSPFANTIIAPTITLNNEPTTFTFSGLIPGLVGVYQVNLVVPTDAINGDLMLTLSENGISSNSGLLPVHN